MLKLFEGTDTAEWDTAMSKAGPQAAKLFEDALNRLRETKDNHAAKLMQYWVYAFIDNHSKDDVDNLAFFCDVIQYSGHRIPMECLEGLSKYDSFTTTHNYLLDASPRHQAQARALIYAVTHMDKHVSFHDSGNEYYEGYDEDGNECGGYYETSDEPDSYYINNDYLVELLLAHPDKAEDIVEIADRDYSIDVALIKEQIMLSEKVLREGVL